jgi:hypothetical protein
MCLTVEWDLLDTASTEEEFDGSWKVRETGSASRSSRRIGRNGVRRARVLIARHEGRL